MKKAKKTETPLLVRLSHLLQFSDSAFPVGTFSFSNGLETASYEKIVYDADTLEQYARSAARQGAFSDGVAALLAYRAMEAGDYARIVEIDKALMRFKMNDEARLMLTRMGKKLAELGVRMFESNDIMTQWIEDINSGKTPGSYPVAQGIVFQIAGLTEEELFASQQYGVVNMILGAALRCVRVSHYDTQMILTALAKEIPQLYEEVKSLDLPEMHCFVPEMDILASLHEKGNMRMFMS